MSPYYGDEFGVRVIGFGSATQFEPNQMASIMFLLFTTLYVFTSEINTNPD